MSESSALDPFGPTANPQLYVPRVATERALDQLVSLVGPERRGLVLLTGPPGLGKTQLLRMLPELLPRGTDALYLPIASLPIGGLCAYALSLLGVSDSDESEARLVEHARRSSDQGRRLVLLCDDASALGASASKLAALVAEAAGSLSAVLVSDDARAGALRSALGPGVPEVSLSDPMTAAETARYVRVRLAEAEIAPPLWQCFDSATLERIHLESKGIPRCVNGEAGALLRDLESRTLNARQEPPEAKPQPEPIPRVPDAATPAPPAEEPPIQPLRAARARRRRTRALRAVELGLASLVAGLVVLLLLRSGVPTSLELFASAPRPQASSPAQEPAAAPPPSPSAPIEVGNAPAPSPPAPAKEAGSPPAARAPSVSPGPPPASSQAEDVAGVSAASPAEPGQSEESKPTRPSPAPASPKAAPPPPPAVAAAPSPTPSPAAPAPPPVATDRPAQPAPAAPAPPSEPPPEQAAAPPAAPAARRAPAAAAEAAPAATISVNVNADPWAQVEVDGKAVGVTPLAGVPLSAGDHRFRATLPDGRVIERTVRIDAKSRFVHFP